MASISSASIFRWRATSISPPPRLSVSCTNRPPFTDSIDARSWLEAV